MQVLCSVLNCQSLRMHKQRLLFEHRISVGYPGTRRVMGSYYPVPILGTGENTSNKAKQGGKNAAGIP